MRQVMGKNKATVLIVDDNQESVKLLRYFLGSEQYQILTAADGHQAIEIARQGNIDIILLDIMLPGKSGYQVCEILKSDPQTFPIPILMITALRELKDKIRGLNAGADDFLPKPFDGVELVARVRSLLRVKYYSDELIRRNNELEKRKRALEREEQFRRDLTDLIVHDMQNPLTVIQGTLRLVEMLRREGEIEDEAKYRRRIERSSHRLHRSILNLLDVHQMEQHDLKVQPAAFPPAEVIENAAGYFRDIPECDGKYINLNMQEDLPYVYLDRGIFERVMDNLFHYVLSNASVGGEVNLEVKYTGGSFVELSLSHPGMPIPSEFHETVFTPHGLAKLRLQPSPPTRGLSLIFCRMALEINCCTIEIDPTFQHGAAFLIRIPVWESQRRETSEKTTEKALSR